MCLYRNKIYGDRSGMASPFPSYIWGSSILPSMLATLSIRATQWDSSWEGLSSGGAATSHQQSGCRCWRCLWAAGRSRNRQQSSSGGRRAGRHERSAFLSSRPSLSLQSSLCIHWPAQQILVKQIAGSFLDLMLAVWFCPWLVLPKKCRRVLRKFRGSRAKRWDLKQWALPIEVPQGNNSKK